MTTDPVGGVDAVELLEHDHQRLEGMFAELESYRVGLPADRRRLADRMTAALVRHAAVEEEVLYPAVRRTVPDGDTIADAATAQHRTAELLLSALADRESTDAGFDAILARLLPAVRDHIAHEREVILPALAARSSAEELRELGRRISDAKKSAPAAPRPRRPDPPGKTAAAAVSAIVDRIRGALTGRDRAG